MAAVDVVVACQPSPSHSILTLTPGRTRNIDQDMEALRLSRQDNPFLQVRIDKPSCYSFINGGERQKTVMMADDLRVTEPLSTLRDKKVEERLRTIQISAFESCEKFNCFVRVEFDRSMITLVVSLKVGQLLLKVKSVIRKLIITGNI